MYGCLMLQMDSGVRYNISLQHNILLMMNLHNAYPTAYAFCIIMLRRITSIFVTVVMTYINRDGILEIVATWLHSPLCILLLHAVATAHCYHWKMWSYSCYVWDWSRFQSGHPLWWLRFFRNNVTTVVYVIPYGAYISRVKIFANCCFEGIR